MVVLGMKKKLMLNTVTSLMLQMVSVICGFILPKLILTRFGSEVNGLVQSIAQFLGVVSFLELGVGQVVQSSLYRPLACKDDVEISRVLVSGEKFFKRIAFLLVVYVIILLGIYPLIINRSYDWIYTAGLIGAMCIGSFAQYYFGIIDRILLSADQRGYIQYFSQIISIILNTIVSYILINIGATIQVIKLSTSLIFLINPVLIRLYIKRNYAINRKIKYEGEPIKQKWNAITQHISAFILNGTDTIVLTVFSTLENVSIYMVYYAVIHGVHQIYQSATSGIHSLVGELWAKQDLDKLNRIYGYIEIALHFSTVFLFGCTGILLIPFVSVYTNEVVDANYIQPLFGILLVLAYASQCLKTTYNIMILAGGHYKQTQRCHIISASLNLIISIVVVQYYGLIGVALGTCVAMGYQTTWMAWYNSKNLIKWPFRNFLKQVVIDIITICLIVYATSWITLKTCTYLAWGLMAIKVAVIAGGIVISVVCITYPSRVRYIYTSIKKRNH